MLCYGLVKDAELCSLSRCIPGEHDTAQAMINY